MHVPDGFLDVPTSLATGVVAAGAVGVALRKARAELDERTAPLAGLTAAFVFAVQMLNFPVGIGTSGHLMGGALAAVLVGPWTAVLCLSVVLLVQALLFADGGVTALGTNVLLIGVVTVLVGWVVTRTALRVLPRRPASVVPAAFAGALLSVPVAALVFVVLYALGGATGVPTGPLLVSMLGWHALIGVGEAVITGLTVSAVVGVRPDLVHAARGLHAPLRLRTAEGEVVVDGPIRQPARSGGRVAAVAAVVSLALAGVVSFYASGSPDGLERVAADRGFLDSARDSVTAGSPFGDYAVDWLGDDRLSVGVAGVVGVLLTVAVGVALFRLLARRRTAKDAERRSPERV